MSSVRQGEPIPACQQPATISRSLAVGQGWLSSGHVNVFSTAKRASKKSNFFLWGQTLTCAIVKSLYYVDFWRRASFDRRIRDPEHCSEARILLPKAVSFFSGGFQLILRTVFIQH